MLASNVSTNITGYSQVNGENVVYMSASVSATNTSDNYINISVVNRDLYNANKKEVRKDITDFESLVYSTEDGVFTESAK